MKPISLLTVFVFMSASSFAQQDTVFIKQSIEWTADTLLNETSAIPFESY